jgi:hypothetical protein
MKMSCELGNQMMDDYFDRLLSRAEEAQFLMHCGGCAQCQQAVSAHSQYLLRLQQFKLAAGSVVNAKASSAQAPAELVQHQVSVKAPNARPSWFSNSTVQRMAAAIAVLGVSLTWYAAELPKRDANNVIDDIGFSKVSIVINAPNDLPGATLTVSLPEGLFVEGYENMNTIALDANFVKGTNKLELPVWIESSFQQDESQFLSATLQYGEQSKTFQFKVDVETTKKTTKETTKNPG